MKPSMPRVLPGTGWGKAFRRTTAGSHYPAVCAKPMLLVAKRPLWGVCVWHDAACLLARLLCRQTLRSLRANRLNQHGGGNVTVNICHIADDPLFALTKTSEPGDESATRTKP